MWDRRDYLDVNFGFRGLNGLLEFQDFRSDGAHGAYPVVFRFMS
jgi:hypothetical protein